MTCSTALVREVGETCNFTTLDGAEVLYLDRVEAKWPLRLSLDVGSHVPLHCTASGKLFLATMPAAQRDALIDRLALPRMTPNTITTRRGAACRMRGDRGLRLLDRPRGIHRRPDRRRRAGQGQPGPHAGGARGPRAERAHAAGGGAGSPGRDAQGRRPHGRAAVNMRAGVRTLRCRPIRTVRSEARHGHPLESRCRRRCRHHGPRVVGVTMPVHGNARVTNRPTRPRRLCARRETT